MNEKPIGIFDSGVGGLTVYREIEKVCPAADIVYFGDTGRYPYGVRSPRVIVEYSRQILQFLLSFEVKFVVVACNSASAMALETIAPECPVPIVGVIKPVARAAAEATRNNKIGVIGTEGTIASGSYSEAIKEIDPELKVMGRPCTLFVALAEEGYIDRPATRMIIADYLQPLKEGGVDTLVLGCTHYPLLQGPIGEVMGESVKIIDSAASTAAEVKRMLIKSGSYRDEEHKGTHRFYVSDTPGKFARVGELFLGRPIGTVMQIDIAQYSVTVE
jgi:glutamate racemase